MRAEGVSEFRVLVSIAKDQGWVVGMTMTNHWKFMPPDQRVPPCYTGGTPKNRSRFVKKLRADLRRRGLEL